MLDEDSRADEILTANSLDSMGTVAHFLVAHGFLVTKDHVSANSSSVGSVMSSDTTFTPSLELEDVVGVPSMKFSEYR